MKRFKNILVFVNGPDSAVALKRAVSLAEENQANLTAIDVLRPPSSLFRAFSGADFADGLRKDVIHQRESELASLIGQHAAAAPTDVTLKVLVGTPYIEIIREVLRANHDLVLKTAEGSGGLSQRIFGGTALNLMRQCPCPVWIVKPEHDRPFKRILAAVDVASDTDAAEHAGLNRHIVEIAKSLAELESAELHVVHTWSLWCESMLKRRVPPAEFAQMLRTQEQESRQSLAKLLASFDLHAQGPQIHLIKGDPGFVIPQLVDKSQIELLVMGTVCRTGIPGFITGNTAELVLSDSDCSMLTLKPDGFESPVTLTD